MDLDITWNLHEDNEAYATLILKSKDNLLTWNIGVELTEVCRLSRPTYEETYGQGPWIMDNKMWKGDSSTGLKWNDFSNTTELSTTNCIHLSNAGDSVQLQVSEEVAKRLQEDFAHIRIKGSFEPIKK